MSATNIGNIDQTILDCVDQYHQAVETLAERYATESETDAAFKVEFAKATLSSVEKAVEMKKADATVRTAAFYEAKLHASALAQVQKERVYHLRAALDAYRTISVNARPV